MNINKDKVKTLFFLSILIIYLLSVMPAQDLPPTNDKLNHIAAFCYLSFLGSFSFKMGRLFLMLFIYGIFIEFTQFFIPGRYCDWKDVVADVVGILTGLILYCGWRNFRQTV
ncbi:VanZ family protein [Desulfurobacterium sp.]